MLKLEPITQLAHSLEDVLSALRDQQLQVNHDVMSALYQGVDVLSDQVEELALHGQFAENTALKQLCQQLSVLATGQTVALMLIRLQRRSILQLSLMHSVHLHSLPAIRCESS